MNNLDQTTLQLTLCSLFLVAAVLMLLLQRKTPEIDGPLYWGVGSLLLVFGMLLFLMHPYSEFIAFVLAGVVIILGWNFYLIGIWKFKKVKTNYWIVIIFPVLELIQGTVFLKLYPLPHIRIANYSFLVFVVSLFIAIEFFKPYRKYLRHAFLIGGGAFLLRAISTLPRSIFALYTHHGDATEATTANLVLTFSAVVLQIVIFGVFILMTLQKQVEQTKKQIQIKNHLFNIIAHDLKGPIGNIREFLKLINSSNNIPQEQKNEILKKLEKLSVSSTELLEDLLLWSNSHRKRLIPELEVVDVSNSISENIELFVYAASKKGITITDCNRKGVSCYTDQKMFNTVLRNVIANAIKFSNNQGEIKIECFENDKQTEINVTDTGIGIEQSKIDNFNDGKVIESTRGTDNENGTGIGLVMCRDFIKKNRGEFKIESKLNFGTRVTIILPSAAHKRKKAPSKNPVLSFS